MKINKHICFGKDKSPELVEFLCSNGIQYKSTGSLITFDILTSSPHWEAISTIVGHRQLVCLSDTTFTKAELVEAEWLCVRSKWLYGYPQPEANFEYRAVTYNRSKYCELCGNGLLQNAPFRLKSIPKWGNRHFMMLNWVGDELFVDDSVKDVLQKQNNANLEFTCVYDKKGASLLPGVYQLSISAKASAGLIEKQDSIQCIYTCPQCGAKKYHPSGIGKYTFQKDALKNMPDICKTNELFGWGKSSHHLILIRQAVYQAIIENKLDRGLVFEPIDLV